MKLLAALLSGLIMTSGPQAALDVSDDDSGFATVRQSRFALGDQGTMTFGELNNFPDRIDYWARYEVGSSEERIVRWTQSKDCPALKDVIDRLRTLPLPMLDIPTFGQNSAGLTLDGIVTDLSVDGRYGGDPAQLSVSVNLGTPVSDWAMSAVQDLKPCWSEKRPLRGKSDGEPIRF